MWGEEGLRGAGCWRGVGWGGVGSVVVVVVAVVVVVVVWWCVCVGGGGGGGAPAQGV